MMTNSPIQSEQIRFAHKYRERRAAKYYRKFKKYPHLRFINWFEQRMVKRALKITGHPQTILDVPCGTGRFWETLKYNSKVNFHVADFNTAMLDVGFEKRDPKLIKDITANIASVFGLPYVDNSFDAIFCLRFIHHISEKSDRMLCLKELHRVTRDVVCLTTWVEATGFKATIQRKFQAFRDPRVVHNKYVFPHAQMVKEYEEAGFEVIATTDALPHIAAWRMYILRKKNNTAHKAPATPHIVCPQCKGELTKGEQQFVCTRDQVAYPLHNGFAMLTTRDAKPLA
jgi:ubiquinone/menaquinone biosynthesis C-methylase UbiE